MNKRLSVSWRLVIFSLMLGILPGIAIASAPDGPTAERIDRHDPAADMNAEEQEADHDRIWAEYQEKFAAWLTYATSSDVDYSALERVDLQVLTDAPGRTLAEAAKDADLIVLGTVVGIEFLPTHVALVDVRVERTLKGVDAPELTITQLGGPQPATADWEGMVLAETDFEPLLLPGDRAILMLESDGENNYLQAHTGELRVAGDLVTALESHPSKELIDGKTVDEILVAILGGLP